MISGDDCTTMNQPGTVSPGGITPDVPGTLITLVIPDR